MNQTNQSKLIILATIVMVAVVIAAGLMLHPVQAQGEPSLAELALKADDLNRLPEISSSRLISSAPSSADDDAQPLSRRYMSPATPNEFAPLFDYGEVYAVGALVGGGNYSAYAGNYLYRYADSAQANAAADQWIKLVLQSPQSKLLDIGLQSPNSDMRGRTAMLIGSEGDVIYWLVGTKGRTLILLMVNGMPDPSTQKTFKALATRVLQR